MNDVAQITAGELNNVTVVLTGGDRYIEVSKADDSVFDSVKAHQARADLIKATILFFGLDNECLFL